nr:PREDICTED: uncharacterized protein LOC102365856 [Latimeria chalumnae]|eukprot:XP_006005177.1 PREDICTED: uncharacterized protein LOC102365856 [Latimeria chalumnae]
MYPVTETSGSSTDVFLTADGCAPWMLYEQKQRSMSAPARGDEGWAVTGQERDARSSELPLQRMSNLRARIQSMDVFRRHSWEPGKELQYDSDYDQHSVSLEGLDDPDKVAKMMGTVLLRGRDPRRAPIMHSTHELESLLAEEEGSHSDMTDSSLLYKNLRGMKTHASQPQSYASSSPICVTLIKSVSMSGIDRTYQDPDEIPLYSSGKGLNDR